MLSLESFEPGHVTWPRMDWSHDAVGTLSPVRQDLICSEPERRFFDSCDADLWGWLHVTMGNSVLRRGFGQPNSKILLTEILSSLFKPTIYLKTHLIVFIRAQLQAIQDTARGQHGSFLSRRHFGFWSTKPFVHPNSFRGVREWVPKGLRIWLRP